MQRVPRAARVRAPHGASDRVGGPTHLAAVGRRMDPCRSVTERGARSDLLQRERALAQQRGPRAARGAGP
eukprot:3799464-Prymnesium_polylepis.1